MTNQKGKDPANLKYALYARKSTEESSKQVNSIEDQIAECMAYANAEGLNVVAVITEQKSAKYSHNRPKFDEMISKIELGEYDAILAWHPDRLARNMLEAGQILDMLTPPKEKTEPLLKALAFPTISYSNDSGGRLTLAVLFSLATQYSEHLSESVSRGHSHNLQRGKSAGMTKWGYKRSETGYYVPDDCYDDIKRGWKMILDGESQAEVLRDWEKRDVHYTTKPKNGGEPKDIRPTKQSLTLIFRDTVYYGELQQAGESVDLTTIPEADFKPMITKEEYDKVQQILDGRHTTHRRRSNATIPLPLRGMLYCDCCGHKMYPGASGGNAKGKKFIYYHCQNKECERTNKAVRAKVVFDELCKMLNTLKLDENTYDEYSKAVDEYAEETIAELKNERSSLNGTKRRYANELKTANANYSNLVKPSAKTPKATLKEARKRINELDAIIREINDDIKAVNEQIKDPNSTKLTKEEFLNLISTSGKRLKNGTFAEKDAIVRKLFLNLRLTDKNSLIYLCKPEFDGLLEIGKVNNGGRRGT